MIKKEDHKYVVMNKAGTKVMGTHKTHREALQQMQAIEIAKHKGKK